MSEMGEIEYTPTALAFPIEAGLVQACREALGATLRAVVLTGSLARNEGSYILKEGQTILLSDVEAIVVLHDDAPLPSRESTKLLCDAAEQMLAARGVRVDVSLSLVHAAYLRQLPPHIYSFELRACGVVLFGDPAILEQIPNFAAPDLSAEDAWRMLSNRLIEQMEITATTKDSNSDALRYRSIKLCLDLASSLLVLSGRFEAGYRARLHCMEEFAVTPSAKQLPIFMEEFLPLVRMCTAAKLQPETVVDLGPDFAERVTGWAWQIWLWELRQMNGDETHTTARAMIRGFGRKQGAARLLRGWLYAARRSGWLSSARYWPRWLSQLALGLTPRHAIYLAAYGWHEARKGNACDSINALASVHRLLPVDGGAQVVTGTEVAAQVVWNYKQFAMETRS
jgi:hypothetical protein